MWFHSDNLSAHQISATTPFKFERTRSTPPPSLLRAPRCSREEMSTPMRWSVLKKKKRNKCSRGSISSCPYLRSLLEKSGCGGDEQKGVKRGGNG